jgi:hypothetical protein
MSQQQKQPSDAHSIEPDSTVASRSSDDASLPVAGAVSTELEAPIRDSILRALVNCPHQISIEEVRLFSEANDGRTTLGQVCDRLEEVFVRLKADHATDGDALHIAYMHGYAQGKRDATSLDDVL